MCEKCEKHTHNSGKPVGKSEYAWENNITINVTQRDNIRKCGVD
jgi:hypothetical protein